MSNYALTNAGASWIANRLCNSNYGNDISIMYVIYSNGGTDHIAFTTDFTCDDLLNLPSDVGYIRKEGGLVGYSNVDDSNNHEAVISGVVTDKDYGNGAELIAGTSKIIAVAIGYKDTTGKDVIITACNMVSTPAIKWVANMSMSVACPISIPTYPEG